MDILRDTAADETFFENITFGRNSEVIVSFQTCHSEKIRRPSLVIGPLIDKNLNIFWSKKSMNVQNCGLTVRGDGPWSARFLHIQLEIKLSLKTLLFGEIRKS